MVCTGPQTPPPACPTPAVPQPGFPAPTVPDSADPAANSVRDVNLDEFIKDHFSSQQNVFESFVDTDTDSSDESIEKSGKVKIDPYNQDKRDKTGDKVECDLCFEEGRLKYSFSRYAFDRHLKTVHGSNSEHSRACLLCGWSKNAIRVDSCKQHYLNNHSMDNKLADCFPDLQAKKRKHI